MYWINIDFTAHQVIAVIKSVEAGRTVNDVCREADISEDTYNKRKSRYGGMESSDIKKISFARYADDSNVYVRNQKAANEYCAGCARCMSSYWSYPRNMDTVLSEVLVFKWFRTETATPTVPSPPIVITFVNSTMFDRYLPFSCPLRYFCYWCCPLSTISSSLIGVALFASTPALRFSFNR